MWGEYDRDFHLFISRTLYWIADIFKTIMRSIFIVLIATQFSSGEVFLHYPKSADYGLKFTESYFLQIVSPIIYFAIILYLFLLHSIRGKA